MAPKLRANLTQRILAGAVAGLPAGVAHALVNEIDRKVFRYDSDDMVMVTGFFMDDRSRARLPVFFLHLSFAMAFGIGYAVVLNPRDDDDAIIRGIGAGVVETRSFGRWSVHWMITTPTFAQGVSTSSTIPLRLYRRTCATLPWATRSARPIPPFCVDCGDNPAIMALDVR